MSKKIEDILEEYGFSISDEDGDYDLQLGTPAGEDWHIILNRLEDIVDYAEDFDPDSEFEMWVEAKMAGDSSIPGYSELLEDQQWKKDLLMKIAKEIRS